MAMATIRMAFTKARWLFILIPAAVLVPALLAGCTRDRDEQTKTDRVRSSLDLHVQRLMLGSEAAYERGDFLRALVLADSAGRHAPDLADVDFLRGRIFTEMNQIEAANARYAAVLEIDPAYRGANMNIGINHFRRGRLRDAVEAFRREEAIEPNPGLYLEMGRTYAKLGLGDSALWSYGRSIELDGTNATAHMWMGQLHEEMGDFEEAQASSRRGLALRPDNLDYQYILGSQLLRTGNVEEAASQLRTVAEARPWHHGAQYNMGQALMRLGREAEAEEYLAQAEVAQQVQQEINEAHEAINREPGMVRHWVRLGEAHRKAAMYDRAVDAYKRAIVLAPRDLDLHTNLATLMLESGDAEGAIRQYRAIVDADPSKTDAWLNLGAAYGNAERYEQARTAWDMVLTLDPGNRSARGNLRMLDRIESGEPPR